MDELEPVLTETGWFVVETIERMQHMQFSVWDICDALNIQERMVYLMLAQAEMERAILEADARDGSS